MSERFDLLVIGAGPAGMKAAVVASGLGLAVALVDENAQPGGQIWRGAERGGSSHTALYQQLRSALLASSVQMLCGWRVIAKVAKKTLRLECDGEAIDLRYGNLLLATGARERFLPFPGWTLPGVVGAAGLQALLKSGFDPAGRNLVLAGSGPLLFPVAALVRSKAARLVAVCEQASVGQMAGLLPELARHPSKLLEGAVYAAKMLPATVRNGWWVKRAEGQQKVESAVLTNGQQERRVDCNLLAVGFHLVANLELPLLMGCKINQGLVAVDDLLRSSVEDVFCAGELTGIGGLNKALLEGEIAALAAAGQTARARRLTAARERQQQFARALDAAYALRPEVLQLAEEQTLVCRCEDVRHGDLKSHPNWREAKLATRCGMGACQGRSCGPAVEALYGWSRQGVRPPVAPAAVMSLAEPMDETND